MRGLLTQEEVSKLREYAENDADINKYAYEVEDGKGGKSRLCIWNHPGDDASGRIIRFVVNRITIVIFSARLNEYEI